MPGIIKNYQDLIRYLSRHEINQEVARSFIRLIKDSEYELGQSRFVFRSVHHYYTEPRLRQFSREIGVIWTRIGEDWHYQKRYIWTVGDRLSGGLLDQIVEVKMKQDAKNLDRSACISNLVDD